MNDICKSCGAELPPSPRRPCPQCGETARVIQAAVHAMAGPAICEAKGVVIRPAPVVLERSVPDVEIVVSESPKVEDPPSGQELLEQRLAALNILFEDFVRARYDQPLRSELWERFSVLMLRILFEKEGGDYDG